MYWVNGREAETISLHDRSFQYGDGCFTTMLVKGGQVQYWDLHKERMQSCLGLLGISPPDWSQVEGWMQNAITGKTESGIKLHISRGEGGRGYSPSKIKGPNVIISAFDFPAHYASWMTEGVQLGICSNRLGHNPMLAGHKHNNRLEQVLLKSEMDEKDLSDGIVLDIKANVIETTMANVFWVNQGVVYTPDLTNAGVKGVMQRVIIDSATKNGIEVRVGDYSLKELYAAEEVFISNSLLRIAPVKAIGSQSYAKGSVTKTIQEMINQW
ncbi:aminodeoxychorismate lyase [Vibrio sp. OCN044]|uniref:Aminodeoxychorismate lyase n=1 Tax=Vibrio tetraodonis subsp. pristinus TaxID=2695891 RepID=A0A6L8M2X3_9VIBR|nr:aminodeoxychorismate lyase [Vibrio tetraodonis]MYM59932.1 aminodeoxychorismate lyase [Vibrio tetraodonis subsp. pristinus]